MKAMIMAAGVGTRLRPLTCRIPKPMVPVINKPVMEHVINLLVKYKVKDIIVNLHHYPDSIRDYFGDGSKFGVSLHYSYEEKLMGTAGGVKKVEHFFDDTFLVLSGDGLSDINIEEAVEFHKSKKALATIVLKEVDFPLEYGVVIVNNEGRITRFLEKPSWGEVFSNTANTGVYIFETGIFKEIPYGEEYDFGAILFPKLLKEKQRLFGYITHNYWCDIGDLPEYRQTHYDILQKKVNINITGTEKGKDIWIGDGTIIHPDAKITGPVIIGRNCNVEEDAEISEFTTLGDNVTIGKGSSIKRCVIWDNTYISEYDELRGCIIGKNCFMEGGVTIYEGAVIGDGSTIGQKAVIKTNVRVWPDKIIETGVTLSTSLIWGEKWRKNLFGFSGVFGKANVEITPEFAAKLGTAYATCLSKNSSVMLSASGDKMCKMLKRVMEGGIISAGVNIYDADNMPSFLNQFAVIAKGVSGGVYINKALHDNNSISIEFFDSQGLNIDRSMEKKIEKVFYREEFIRVMPSEFGKIIPSEKFEKSYMAEINNFINKGKGNLKIILRYENGVFPFTDIKVEKLLNEIGCEVILAGNDDEIGSLVVREKAQIGIRVDTQAERFYIIDENGVELKSEHALVLMIYLVLKNSMSGDIAVPVNISKIVEDMALKFNRKLFRTKREERHLIKTSMDNNLIFSGMGDGRYLFAKFKSVFDPIVSILKLAEFISGEKEKISKIFSTIPEYYIEVNEIPCPWEYKGRILQDIIEEYKDSNIELIDGVKINFDSGEWILILQDPEEPFLHLWVEGNTRKKAEELLGKYKEKITQLINL
ncbi:NTP transferase domain-containing protein [Candidatus Desantisbacteria bacterium]|nr:NTP transferase domain-containing protein [Candidatus Desantisbacteria bacterium]